MNKYELEPAAPITIGIEDRFYFTITDECVRCGACADSCPVSAIRDEDGRYVIDPHICIDCGTCSAVCPAGAARPAPFSRESINIEGLVPEHCLFNPGCAMDLYRHEDSEKIYAMLRENFGEIKLHNVCCVHDPGLPAGSTIINNCAGCDRRFRSLYEGVDTISLWEVLDSIEGLPLPDHSGLTVSVHDSCGYRHKPQVHRAIRSLLAKMNIEVIESEFSGTESVCCGDNLYGKVPNEQVEARIKLRADQLPCENVVVYCIGCLRAMEAAGKKPCYLPDLVSGFDTAAMPDTLDEYHSKLGVYVDGH